MKLQYSGMISSGTTWIDCQDRFDEFVGRAAKYHGHSVDQIVNDGLLGGKTVSIEDGWDGTSIRDFDSIEEPAPVTPDTRKLLTCNSCGQTGHAGCYPFSTLPGGGVCDDCC